MTDASPHPGGFIRREIIERHGLSVGDAAEALRVTRPTLSILINERASLTWEMATRIEKAFGLPMERLMAIQHAHDGAEARRRADEIDVPRYVAKAEPKLQESLL